MLLSSGLVCASVAARVKLVDERDYGQEKPSHKGDRGGSPPHCRLQCYQRGQPDDCAGANCAEQAESCPGEKVGRGAVDLPFTNGGD